MILLLVMVLPLVSVFADPIMSFYRPSFSPHEITGSDAVSLFSFSERELESRYQQLTEMTKARVEAIVEIAPEKRTYANTVRAFQASDNELDSFAAVVSLLSYVAPQDDLREAASRLSIELSDFSRNLYMDKKLYEIFREYEENMFPVEQATVTREELRFFDDLLRNFKKSGYHLPADEFNQLKEIGAQLSRESHAYMKAINDDASCILASEDELSGVAQDFIDNLARNEDGLCIVRCNYLSLDAVMGYCRSADVRKRLSLAYGNRCYPENVTRLESILRLRDESAHFLGFSSAAESYLDGTMAKSVQNTEDFIASLSQRCEEKNDTDFAILTADLPEGICLLDNGRLNAYDAVYVENHYKQKHFNVDERKIAEYFPVESTLSGMLKVYEEFLGLTFVQVPCSAWHEDVRLVEVSDRENDKKLGYIFFDLFPRPNKYSHACCCSIIPAVTHTDGEQSLFVGMIIANFPQATEGKPGLLTFNDVQVFFHEFGHCMHGLMGRTSLAAHSGTRVKRDFIETPSQMFERWVEQPEILKIISSHYITGEPLPEPMVSDMLTVKNFDFAGYVLAQLKFALISLRLHGSDGYINSTQVFHDILRSYGRHYEFNPLNHMHAAFGHLMGYGATYYGYMWSKVFADDLFLAVKERGLLDPAVGRDFVAKVLGKGGSEEPSILLENFLGRKPSIQSFLSINGLDA